MSSSLCQQIFVVFVGDNLDHDWKNNNVNVVGIIFWRLLISFMTAG
jgi:hypothetical protein